jgi:exonuclease VII large subunit
MKQTLLVLGVALLSASAAFAHHSFAKDYQEDKQITLEGDITSIDLRNPHSWVYFTAKDSTGVARKYGAEWFNLRRLTQAGITATTISVGDHVVVTGAPNRVADDYSIHLKSIRRPSDGWGWPSGGGGRVPGFSGSYR